MIRWIIKIILFQISVALSILTAFLTFLLSIGTAILYLLMLMCVFTVIGSFFMLHNTKVAIEALIIGFLLWEKWFKNGIIYNRFKVRYISWED